MRNHITPFRRFFVVLILCGLPHGSCAQSQRLYHTTVPFTQIRNSAAVIAIKLNDKTVGHFLLDSGTSPSMITDTMATKLGLTSKPRRRADGSIGAFLGQEERAVTVPLSQIGALQFADLEFGIIPEQWLRKFLDTDITPDQSIDGMIGGPFFYSLATLIDFQAREITIWSGGKITEEDLKSVHMTDLVPIDMELEKSTSYFTVSVRINGRQREKLRIDTGAAFSYLSARLVRSLHLKPTGHIEESATALGKISIGNITVQELAIGPLLVDKASLKYTVSDTSDWPPRLGLDLLKNTVVLIDGPGRKLYLKPTKFGQSE